MRRADSVIFGACSVVGRAGWGGWSLDMARDEPRRGRAKAAREGRWLC